MKICLIGPAYPYKGGIAAFNERLTVELQQKGHKVDILTFTLQYPKVFFPGKSQFSTDQAPDLQIERGINTINPLSWLRYGKKYRSRGYDLVIGRFWLPLLGPALGFTIRSIAKKSGCKSIAIVDNIIPHEKRPGDRPLAQYFVNGLEGFVVMSHKVEQDMRRFTSGQPIVYAPHPIYDSYGAAVSRELALTELGLDPEKQYLLFFGFIRKYKGLDLLLRAFAKALKQVPQLQLLVAGEYYSDQEQYELLLDDLNIRGRVEMHTHFIDNDRVKLYFCGADLVAQTYRSATQSGISQIALHFDKPILSTNVGGLPETTIHDETGYLVDVDTTQIASAIIRHFSQDPLPQFTEGIQDLKRNFSWSLFADRLLSLYKQL